MTTRIKKTKLLAFVLMLAMILTLVPIMALADDTWDSVTVDGLTVSVSSGTEALAINQNSAYDFDIDSTDGDYPFSFSMILTTGKYEGTPTVTNGGIFTVYSSSGGNDYCLVTLPEGTTSTVQIQTKDNKYDLTFNCEEPTGGTAGSSGTGIYSFLPAPGQFVNEGIDSGGWGDIYQSGGTALKTLVDANFATGVSLGAYGGSIVFDFGESGIDNTNTNKYGVDFIVYGNAFTNWSEPGCIQVAQDLDNNGVPDTWYDIAGSRHYMSGTDWDCEFVYGNPTPSDNTSGTSTRVNVPYADTDNVSVSGSTQTWSSYSEMTTNAYHDHSWFPLARNYFDATDNTATAYTGAGVSGLMANIDQLSFATLKESQTIQDGDTPPNAIVGSATATLAYKGVNLNQTAPTTMLYTFGYADVHANGSNYGTTSYNPYAATDSSTGGDPIDISWAVNSDGEPVSLSNIRFVRVYTGTMNVSAVFGETSTEIKGIYDADDTGSGAAQYIPTIKYGQSQYYMNVTVNHSNMGTTTINLNAGTYYINAAENNTDYFFINGVSKTSGQAVPFTVTSGETTYVQVITQDSTNSPYITLIKFVGN